MRALIIAAATALAFAGSAQAVSERITLTNATTIAPAHADNATDGSGIARDRRDTAVKCYPSKGKPCSVSPSKRGCHLGSCRGKR